jgi:hypothetical protein
MGLRFTSRERRRPTDATVGVRSTMRDAQSCLVPTRSADAARWRRAELPRADAVGRRGSPRDRGVARAEIQLRGGWESESAVRSCRVRAWAFRSARDARSELRAAESAGRNCGTTPSRVGLEVRCREAIAQNADVVPRRPSGAVQDRESGKGPGQQLEYPRDTSLARRQAIGRNVSNSSVRDARPHLPVRLAVRSSCARLDGNGRSSRHTRWHECANRFLVVDFSVVGRRFLLT